MKKILKVLGSAVVSVYFSVCMFYCFISGAPAQQESLVIYVIVTAGFCIGLPAFVCACIHYILYLQKKLAQITKNQDP